VEQLIVDITSHLKQGHYQNESAIREAVVLPLLRELGWDTQNPQQVFREFPVEAKRVDYALWPAPGLNDTQLSESCLPLELHRA
jgi:predicted type IV restriction endonuclease